MSQSVVIFGIEKWDEFKKSVADMGPSQLKLSEPGFWEYAYGCQDHDEPELYSSIKSKLLEMLEAIITIADEKTIIAIESTYFKLLNVDAIGDRNSSRRWKNYGKGPNDLELDQDEVLRKADLVGSLNPSRVANMGRDFEDFDIDVLRPFFEKVKETSRGGFDCFDDFEEIKLYLNEFKEIVTYASSSEYGMVVFEL